MSTDIERCSFCKCVLKANDYWGPDRLCYTCQDKVKVKMTDLEKWKAHFDAFKVKYEITEYPAPPPLDIYGRPQEPHLSDATIALGTDEGEGYGGFTFVAYFNLDGSFKAYGVWE